MNSFGSNKDAPVLIAGARGMVGSALRRLLEARGYTRLLCPRSSELDARNQAAVQAYFEQYRPAYVLIAAAKVGGIHANNTYRAEFLYDNLMMEANLIEASYRSGVTKLLFLGSSCIYPKHAPQPISEDALLTGPLEPTNEPYALAKIAGIKLCDAYRHQYGCDFISVMPTNLYGPGDNYDPENSHVLPALIRKVHAAKTNGDPTITLWGSGTPLREFLYVDDLAEACLLAMEVCDQPGFLNIGYGSDLIIHELASTVCDVLDYGGEILLDSTKPDG
ncbi:MAG: GDP-L-fucose synthase family protein, partial [Bacteroidia bacterium]